MNVNSLKLIIVAIAIGFATGIGVYTFWYAQGYSYFSNQPNSCANCHIMNEQYSGWLKSSHKAVATCNDCHTPDGFVSKYATKASNGFWHSFYFTTGGFHEPIQIGTSSLAVVEQSCKKCHQTMVESIAHKSVASEMSCVRCHRSVGHPK